jgi:signal transduction histidine kinase
MKIENAPEIKVPYILIVDDINENLKLLGDILKGEGYKIRPVPSGELALKVAEKEKPGLILLDIMMPGMNGYQVCSLLKENPGLKDVPVIFISALNETADIVKALSAGGVDYITKPFQTEEVIARVNTHFKLYKQSKELKELYATKDKFFSIIAHDLRSPFTAFLGLTQMMVEDVKTLTPGEIEEMAGIVNNSATKLFSLLENLLQWSLMQSGNASFKPESFFLQEKIADSLALVFDASTSKAIETVSEISHDIKVYADVRMLETIIRNLLTNAVKFTPRGGRVMVSARLTDHDFTEICVRDTGIGVPDHLINNLFMVDKRTGRNGTEGEPSSGLGLIICKDFIIKHGGTIRVESEEGNGTAFYFTIPNSPG